MTRRAAILIAAVATVLVLVGGVALAASVRCGGRECRDTPKADEMLDTAQRDVMRSFGATTGCTPRLGTTTSTGIWRGSPLRR
jgi:hypothetical protein